MELKLYFIIFLVICTSCLFLIIDHQQHDMYAKSIFYWWYNRNGGSSGSSLHVPAPAQPKPSTAAPVKSVAPVKPVAPAKPVAGAPAKPVVGSAPTKPKPVVGGAPTKPVTGGAPTVFSGKQAAAQAKAAAATSKQPTVTMTNKNGTAANIPVSSQTTKVTVNGKSTSVPSMTVGGQTAIVVGGKPIYGTIVGGVFKPLSNQSTANTGLVGLMTGKGGGVALNPAAAQVTAGFATNSGNRRGAASVPPGASVSLQVDSKGGISVHVGTQSLTKPTVIIDEKGKSFVYKPASGGAKASLTPCSSGHDASQLRALGSGGGASCPGALPRAHTYDLNQAAQQQIGGGVVATPTNLGHLPSPTTVGSGGTSYAMSHAVDAYHNYPGGYQAYAQSMLSGGNTPITLAQWNAIGRDLQNQPAPARLTLTGTMTDNIAGARLAAAAGFNYTQYVAAGGSMELSHYNNIAQRVNPSAVSQQPTYNPHASSPSTFTAQQTRYYPPTPDGASNAARNHLTFDQYMARNPSVRPGSSEYRALLSSYNRQSDVSSNFAHISNSLSDLVGSVNRFVQNGVTFPEMMNAIANGRGTMYPNPTTLTTPQIQAIYNAYSTAAHNAYGVTYPTISPITSMSQVQDSRSVIGEVAPSAPPLADIPSAPPLPPRM